MQIGDFFGALRRRWLLVLIGFLMTVGLSGVAYIFIKPTYEITGTVLLLPPPVTSETESVNPYLRLGGLQQIVDLVGVSLSDQAAQQEFKAISQDVDFTVRADVRTSSPLLVVDVKDSSPETASRIRDILVARVPVRVEAMQKQLNIDSKDWVTTTVVTLDGQAEEVGKNRLRAAVVAGVGGLSLTLLVASLWDARRLRHPRRRRRRKKTPEPARASTPSAEATVEPAGDRVVTPVSPASPPQAHEALEEGADAPGDATL